VARRVWVFSLFFIFYFSQPCINKRRSNSSSITFEHIPSDYAILKIVKTPEDAGGDTLWASGYEAYDRLSPTFQKLAESLTATHYQPAFVEVKEKFGEDLIDEFRGAPENTGLDFKAEQ
jgi:alpha-ketoglutarate-dependent taurine dioxygenase